MFLGVMCAGDRAILAVTVNAVGASGAAPGQAAAAVANHPGASTKVAQKPSGMVNVQHARGFLRRAVRVQGCLHRCCNVSAGNVAEVHRLQQSYHATRDEPAAVSLESSCQPP